MVQKKKSCDAKKNLNTVAGYYARVNFFFLVVRLRFKDWIEYSPAKILLRYNDITHIHLHTKTATARDRERESAREKKERENFIVCS